jgi:OmcA/MtrC family decaheme c-type cytochrome
MGFVMVDDTGAVIEDLTVYNTVNGCVTNPPGTFRGTAASQWDHYTSRPARAVCGGCHANIDFAAGEGHIVQTDDEKCGLCHKPYTGNEYDLSVTGAHTVEYKSNQLDGLLIQIKEVTNGGPGRSPAVIFSASNKYGPINPNALDRLRFKLSGPNEDFDFYASEDAPGKIVQSGSDWSYRFTTKLPKDAAGSYSVSFEARNLQDIDVGGNEPEEVRDTAENYLFAFAVTDDEAAPRRLVVDDAKCENCHANLALHGGNRHNGGEYCQVCHMPGAVGETEVVEGEEDSIHFKYMIHKIHRGEALEFGYAIGGHDYSEVLFPGDLRRCDTCHLAGTATVPLPDDVLPTESPITPINPVMLPTTAACLSCHDSDGAAAHADANTSDNLGESCAACHGETKTFSVTRVHAR